MWCTRPEGSAQKWERSSGYEKSAPDTLFAPRVLLPISAHRGNEKQTVASDPTGEGFHLWEPSCAPWRALWTTKWKVWLGVNWLTRSVFEVYGPCGKQGDVSPYRLLLYASWGASERERCREKERKEREKHARTCGRGVFICVWLERLVRRCYICTIHAYVVYIYIENVTTSIVIAHKPRNYPYIQRRTVVLPPPLLAPTPALNLLCLSESSQLPRILGKVDEISRERVYFARIANNTRRYLFIIRESDSD